MKIIKMNNGFVFHIGRPEVMVSSFNTSDNGQMNRLTEVEQEEEREKRRKFEEVHPEETI